MAFKVEDLDKLIRQLQLRLEKARTDVVRFEAELKGLMSARNALFHHVGSSVAPISLPGREISPEWKEILSYFLKAAPQAISIDEVMQFIASRDLEINRNAVRSQLHAYVNRGFLERVQEGLYRATDAVKRYCD